MRLYSSVVEAVKEIERDLMEMGINNHSRSVQDLNVASDPQYDSKELTGYGYCITKFDDLSNLLSLVSGEKERERISDYCINELLDRVSGLPFNPGMSYRFREEYWSKFLHGNKFSYTYSERFCDQIFRLVSELKESPGSRQCILTVYDKHNDTKNWGGKERIPCSMYYQFMRRRISGKDKLILIYTMRSCDYYTHFFIDIWLAIELGHWVAKQIGSELHSFTHFIGSLHAFAKDYNQRRIF